MTSQELDQIKARLDEHECRAAPCESLVADLRAVLNWAEQLEFDRDIERHTARAAEQDSDNLAGINRELKHELERYRRITVAQVGLIGRQRGKIEELTRARDACRCKKAVEVSHAIE